MEINVRRLEKIIKEEISAVALAKLDEQEAVVDKIKRAAGQAPEKVEITKAQIIKGFEKFRQEVKGPAAEKFNAFMQIVSDYVGIPAEQLTMSGVFELAEYDRFKRIQDSADSDEQKNKQLDQLFDQVQARLTGDFGYTVKSKLKELGFDDDDDLSLMNVVDKIVESVNFLDDFFAILYREGLVKYKTAKLNIKSALTSEPADPVEYDPDFIDTPVVTLAIARSTFYVLGLNREITLEFMVRVFNQQLVGLLPASKQRTLRQAIQFLERERAEIRSKIGFTRDLRRNIKRLGEALYAAGQALRITKKLPKQAELVQDIANKSGTTIDTKTLNQLLETPTGAAAEAERKKLIQQTFKGTGFNVEVEKVIEIPEDELLVRVNERGIPETRETKARRVVVVSVEMGTGRNKYTEKLALKIDDGVTKIIGGSYFSGLGLGLDLDNVAGSQQIISDIASAQTAGTSLQDAIQDRTKPILKVAQNEKYGNQFAQILKDMIDEKLEQALRDPNRIVNLNLNELFKQDLINVDVDDVRQRIQNLKTKERLYDSLLNIELQDSGALKVNEWGDGSLAQAIGIDYKPIDNDLNTRRRRTAGSAADQEAAKKLESLRKKLQEVKKSYAEARGINVSDLSKLMPYLSIEAEKDYIKALAIRIENTPGVVLSEEMKDVLKALQDHSQAYAGALPEARGGRVPLLNVSIQGAMESVNDVFGKVDEILATKQGSKVVAELAKGGRTSLRILLGAAGKLPEALVREITNINRLTNNQMLTKMVLLRACEEAFNTEILGKADPKRLKIFVDKMINEIEREFELIKANLVDNLDKKEAEEAIKRIKNSLNRLKSATSAKGALQQLIDAGEEIEKAAAQAEPEPSPTRRALGRVGVGTSLQDPALGVIRDASASAARIGARVFKLGFIIAMPTLAKIEYDHFRLLGYGQFSAAVITFFTFIDPTFIGIALASELAADDDAAGARCAVKKANLAAKMPTDPKCFGLYNYRPGSDKKDASNAEGAPEAGGEARADAKAGVINEQSEPKYVWFDDIEEFIYEQIVKDFKNNKNIYKRYWMNFNYQKFANTNDVKNWRRSPVTGQVGETAIADAKGLVAAIPSTKEDGPEYVVFAKNLQELIQIEKDPKDMDKADLVPPGGDPTRFIAGKTDKKQTAAELVMALRALMDGTKANPQNLKEMIIGKLKLFNAIFKFKGIKDNEKRSKLVESVVKERIFDENDPRYKDDRVKNLKEFRDLQELIQSRDLKQLGNLSMGRLYEELAFRSKIAPIVKDMKSFDEKFKNVNKSIDTLIADLQKKQDPKVEQNFFEKYLEVAQEFQKLSGLIADDENFKLFVLLTGRDNLDMLAKNAIGGINKEEQKPKNTFKQKIIHLAMIMKLYLNYLATIHKVEGRSVLRGRLRNQEDISQALKEIDQTFVDLTEASSQRLSDVVKAKGRSIKLKQRSFQVNQAYKKAMEQAVEQARQAYRKRNQYQKDRDAEGSDAALEKALELDRAKSGFFNLF